MTFKVLSPAMQAVSILGCNKTFTFYKYEGAEIDAMGRDVPSYADAVTCMGSIQPVSNKMYEQLGLDLNKNYKTVFCPQLIKSIAENIQPDRIVYDGAVYEVVENKNWYETNGYTKVLMVEIKELRNDSGAE